MNRQFRAIVIAVALAAIAVAVISHRNHRSRPDVVGGPVSALVATKLIRKGTPGHVIRTVPGYYKVKDVTRNQVGTGDLVDPAALAGKVARTDIDPGQVLTATDFADSTAFPSCPCANTRAVVVSLGSSRGIDGRIAVGSHVDVWVATSRHSRAGLRALYRNLYVLDVNNARGTVTLNASPQQAGKLIYGNVNDRLVVRVHRSPRH
jgi:hypothetical protein